MLYTGLFKRIIPFVLTFAAGLFIASFFVSLAFPTFPARSERRWSGDCHGKRQLQKENQELRDRMRSLELENEALRRMPDADEFLSDAVPPVALDEHHPPAPPKKPKHPSRTNILE